MMMPSAAMVEAIYDAPGEDSRWVEMIGLLARSVGASGGFLCWRDLRRRRIAWAIGSGLDDRAMSVLSDRFGATDPLLAPAREGKTPTIVFDHEIMPRGELSATPFYNEFMRPFDVARLCMVRLGDCSERTAFLNLFRGERDRDFNGRERREIEPLAGHLGRAFRMHQTLQDATMRAHSAESALDAVDSAIVILDHMGHVATLNAAAERMLDSGLGPRLAEARVVGRDAAETASLQRLIDQALGRSTPELPARGGSLLFERGMGDLPLRIEAAPLGGHPAGGAGRALLRFDPIRGSSDDAGSFGLTKAELRVARAIASGRRLSDLAGEWGASIHTIRGQLKSVFAKTGTHRQAELVRLFLVKGDQIPD